jgi:hypothetical protein
MRARLTGGARSASRGVCNISLLPEPYPDAPSITVFIEELKAVYPELKYEAIK